MIIISSLNLITVGITSIVTLILGILVYMNDRISVTNKSFLFLTALTVAYNLINHLSYQFSSSELTLELIRYTLYFALWQSFSVFLFFYVFPKRDFRSKKSHEIIIVVLLILVSIAILSPYTIINIEQSGAIGSVSKPVYGFGMAVFGLSTLSFIISGFIVLIKKVLNSEGLARDQLKLVAIGTILTFTLILIFNLILPSVFQNVTFVPWASLFTLPFIFFTTYSIVKYNLLNIRIVATELLTFSLWIFLLIRTLLSNSIQEITINAILLSITVLIGIFLIRSVIKEVRQREKIQALAKDLEKANARLKELDQMKTEFVSLATHQIRAPLTAIKGYISLILEGDYGPVSKEISQALDIVQQSANNLVTIVGDFLDVSRIEQGRMKYEFKTFNLEELVRRVIDEYRPNIEKRGLKLNYTSDPEYNYTVYADEGKIKQVVGNIIDNSVKYTPSGSLDVNVSRHGGNLQIKVADTGVGIDPKVMPKLFQKFTRASNANEVNILGTGLGLYVARQLIEAQNGKVWAESEGSHKGSQFYIELPTHATHAAVPSAQSKAASELSQTTAV